MTSGIVHDKGSALSWVLEQTVEVSKGHLMAEVHSNNELLKQPPSFRFCESPVMSSVVALNEVNKIPSRSILTDNCQMLWREEDFLELNDVGMVAAQPLIEDLTACCLDAACPQALSGGSLCLFALPSMLSTCWCACTILAYWPCIKGDVDLQQQSQSCFPTPVRTSIDKFNGYIFHPLLVFSQKYKG